MIGHLPIAASLAKALLVVAPLMSDEPRVPLDTLLAEGFQVHAAIRSEDVVLFLQKGPELYGCAIPDAVLAQAAQPAGMISASGVLCAPFR